ncbi:MAG TPA: type IV toxin-antitoxin system AbiEi family antitoxin domain-containing protein, partial [Streptosporangiaceae bacterium]|nr:type IV toxin-antitoxin system AbiEi family antitoxin domain-containing protein [Streptosporangiaceae bacterium]
MDHDLPQACRELIELQNGLLASSQAAAAGVPRSLIDSRIRRGRWQGLYRGVYAVFTGPPTRDAILWAAVLRGGRGAVLSHQSAAEAEGLIPASKGPVHISMDSQRQAKISRRERRAGFPAIVVHRSTRLSSARHPTRVPPQTRLEETVIDLTQTAKSFDEAFGWLCLACSTRRTTADRLLSTTASRGKARYRSEVVEALGEIAHGVHSNLEYRYVRDVERAHGLPSAIRQARHETGGLRRYLDNLYEDFMVGVELDGRAAHPTADRWRDIHRDNASASAGIITLRYNWA